MSLTLGQILLTAGVCGYAPIPSVSLFWWPVCDAFRVFISWCLRMDFLLREQLEGQESYLARLRYLLVVLNGTGIILALCVFAYKPFITGEPHQFFILTISVLWLHALTCIPTLRYMWQGQDLIRATRPESEDPLLATNQRVQSPENELVRGSHVTSTEPESNYVSPFPQDISLTGQDLLTDLPHLEQSPPTRNLQSALEPNSRSAIMKIQDLEYDIMLADQKQKNELPTQHVIEPLEVETVSRKIANEAAAQTDFIPEVKSETTNEPNGEDPLAVEMRVMAPNGTQITRRFDREATLSLVLDWIKSTLHEMDISHDKEIRLCDRFPRKVYGSSDYERTLESLNFWREGKPAPQRSSMLILEFV